MTGLVLALLYAGWMYLTGTTMSVTYQSAVGFLHTWYIWTTVLIVILDVVIMLAVQLGLTGVGASEGGAAGAVLGFLGGGALSCLVLVFVAISRACLIIGSLLLTQAMTLSEPTWDTTRLVFGAVLLLVGVILGRSSSSSSSSSSKSS